MASKSIITVDVDDSAFQAFTDRFAEYNAKLDQQPELWERLKGSIDGPKAQIAAAAAQAGLITDALKDATKAQDAFVRSASSGETRLKGIAKTAQSITGSIGSATGGIVKMVASLAGGAGIGGILGGLGLGVIATAADALASSALSRQRSAFGLGLNPGQLSSFQVYGQQFLGTGAVQAAAGAQVDLTKAGYLGALGINYGTAANESASDLAFQELSAARKIWQQAAPGTQANQAGIMAYQALGGNIQDVRNAAAYSDAEFANAQKNVKTHAAQMEFSKTAGDRLAAAKMAADSLAVTAETKAIQAFSHLAPAATEVIDKFTAALDKATSELGGFSGALHSIAQWIHPTKASVTKAVGITPNAGTSAYLAGIEHGSIPSRIKNFFAPSPAVKRALSSITGGGSNSTIVAIISEANRAKVDPMLAIATAIHESSLNPNTRVMDHYANGAPAGYSTGLYQLNEHGEGAGMTVAQMTNAATNARVALTEFARVQKLHPNWSAGDIAAGAQRPANKTAYAAAVQHFYDELTADYKSHGADWMKYLPSDLKPYFLHSPGAGSAITTPIQDTTTKLLKAVKGALAKPVQVSLAVSNATGARISTQVNAAAGAV